MDCRVPLDPSRLERGEIDRRAQFRPRPCDVLDGMVAILLDFLAETAEDFDDADLVPEFDEVQELGWCTFLDDIACRFETPTGCADGLGNGRVDRSARRVRHDGCP